MQAHAEKILVDTIQIQIKNLRENADVYKSIHGKLGYNELLVSLINKITGTNQRAGTTPSFAAVSSRLSCTLLFVLLLRLDLDRHSNLRIMRNTAYY